jgi:hypothetical protein
MPRPDVRALLFAVLVLSIPLAAPARAGWRTLEPGLEWGEFEGPSPSIGDSKIRLLRISPERFELRLLNASATPEKKAQTARRWCETRGALAAINASMFLDDGKRSVSHMKTRWHTNHAALSRDNAMLVFDALSPGLQPVRILDREEFADAESYGTHVQSIRMVSGGRTNRWSLQPKKWSTAAIGLDDKGRVLFVHARSPWPVHELIEGLLKLPIGLARLMYTEGGPEASLFVQAGGAIEQWVGSYETGFNENDDNVEAWPIPNVVAVFRRGPASAGPQPKAATGPVPSAPRR